MSVYNIIYGEKKYAKCPVEFIVVVLENLKYQLRNGEISPKDISFIFYKDEIQQNLIPPWLKNSICVHNCAYKQDYNSLAISVINSVISCFELGRDPYVVVNYFNSKQELINVWKFDLKYLKVGD